MSKETERKEEKEKIKVKVGNNSNNEEQKSDVKLVKILNESTLANKCINNGKGEKIEKKQIMVRNVNGSLKNPVKNGRHVEENNENLKAEMGSKKESGNPIKLIKKIRKENKIKKKFDDDIIDDELINEDIIKVEEEIDTKTIVDKKKPEKQSKNTNNQQIINSNKNNNENEKKSEVTSFYSRKAHLFMEITSEKLIELLKRDFITNTILKHQPKNKPLLESHSNLIVEQIVHGLLQVDLEWESPHFEVIAQNIVDIFPQESVETYWQKAIPKSESNSGKSVGATGKVTAKFKNVLSQYRTILQLMKKRKSDSNLPTSSPKVSRKEDQNVDVQASLDWLEKQENDKELLIRHWQRTSKFRHDWIIASKHTKIEPILNEWSAFKNVAVAPDLINIDFEELEDTKHSVTINEWNRLIEIVEELYPISCSNGKALKKLIEGPNISIDVKVAAQLLLLPTLISPRAKTGSKGKSEEAELEKIGIKKFSAVEAKDSLLVVVPREDMIQSKRDFLMKNAETIQPFILCVGASFAHIQKIFVSIDSLLFEVPSMFEAIDLCFKSFHVLHASYPKASGYIWSLLQRGLYKFTTPYDGHYPGHIMRVVKQMESV